MITPVSMAQCPAKLRQVQKNDMTRDISNTQIRKTNYLQNQKVNPAFGVSKGGIAAGILIGVVALLEHSGLGLLAAGLICLLAASD